MWKLPSEANSRMTGVTSTLPARTPLLNLELRRSSLRHCVQTAHLRSFSSLFFGNIFLFVLLTRNLRSTMFSWSCFLGEPYDGSGVTFDLLRDHHLRGEVSDPRLRFIQLRLSWASGTLTQVDSRDGDQCSEQSALLFVCLPRAPS